MVRRTAMTGPDMTGPDAVARAVIITAIAATRPPELVDHEHVTAMADTVLAALDAAGFVVKRAPAFDPSLV